MRYYILFFALIFSNLIFGSAVSAQDGTKSPVNIFLNKNNKKSVDRKKQEPSEPEKKIFSTASKTNTAKTDSSSACNMTISRSPALRGLKLGMSIEDVEKLFPDTPLRLEKYGMPPPHLGFRSLRFGSFGPSIKSAKIDLSGLSDGRIEFLDDVLTSIRFFYENANFYQKENEFRSKVAESLNLPNVWEGNYLNCGEFRVKIAVKDYTLVELENISTDEIVKQRAKEEENRRRDVFKP